MKLQFLILLNLRSVCAGVTDNVLASINDYRVFLGGCSELVHNPCFTNSAQHHADQMAEFQQLGYDDFVTGDTPDYRVTEAFGCSGFSSQAVAETATTQGSSVADEFMNSESAKILDCSPESVGIAYKQAVGGSYYWALDMGSFPVTTTSTITTTTSTINTTTSTTTHAPFPDDCIQALIAHANEERDIKGCASPITLDPCMTPSAQSHSEDMVENRFFDANSSDGTGPTVRVREIFGCQHFFEEAIFNSYATEPEAFVGKYMNGSGRRSKILDCSNVLVGIGSKKAAANASYFWTFDYGTSSLP